MPDFKDLFTFESENEYESAYDLAKERNFSRPKIYSGKGDLKKRWYVYYSFRDPKTGNLKRQTPISKENQKTTFDYGKGGRDHPFETDFQNRLTPPKTNYS